MTCSVVKKWVSSGVDNNRVAPDKSFVFKAATAGVIVCVVVYALKRYGFPGNGKRLKKSENVGAGMNDTLDGHTSEGAKKTTGGEEEESEEERRVREERQERVREAMRDLFGEDEDDDDVEDDDEARTRRIRGERACRRLDDDEGCKGGRTRGHGARGWSHGGGVVGPRRGAHDARGDARGTTERRGDGGEIASSRAGECGVC